MSWQMRLLAGVLRATRRRNFTSREAGQRLLHRPKGPTDPPRRDRLDVGLRQVAGFPVHALRAHGGPALPGSVVLLHGGAYVASIHAVHWRLAGDLAALGCEVLVPHYGLAPQHGPEEAHRLVHEVLAGIDGPSYLLGDSAGGGLALAATQTWLAGGGVPPRGLTLIAPWLDLAIRNPDVDAIEPHDPWLARPGLRPVAEAWAGALSMDDPRVSPLFGSMAGLPPLDLYVGTRDIGLADARLLVERAPQVRYHEEPGAVHVYPLLPFVPEGVRARREILAQVRRALS